MTRRVKNSLTAKIFLITCLLLVSACILTYGFIAWVMPMTYTAGRSQTLTQQAQRLAGQLELSTLEDCGPLLSRFAMEFDAQVSIMDGDGMMLKDTFSGGLHTEGDEGRTADVAGIRTGTAGDPLAVAADEDANVMQAIGFSFSFASSPEVCQLVIVGNMKSVNQAAEALGRIWPWLVCGVLAISVLSSAFYAVFITRPIVQISAISKKIAGLDFDWRCREKRTDEIGVLAHSLNELSEKLSDAMSELKNANASLQADIDRERELEQQRMDFFSAVSHELKTPITVVKGQLSGMLDGVGIYADRDRYLARSLTVMGQMEGLVQELLTVSRMEKGDASFRMTPVNLTGILRGCLHEYADLFEQKEQQLCTELAEELWVEGDPALLSKAIRNVFSNGALYSPEGAKIRIAAWVQDDTVIIQVENMGAHLAEEAIPHLFEAFYRADPSRNRQTGGSGLGLYLVKKILDRHDAACQIENTEGGVCVELRFKRRPSNSI